MSLDFVLPTVSAAAAVTAAVYHFGRKVLKGTEALLLDLVPVIHALGDRPASPRQSLGGRRTRVLSPDMWREVRRLRARGMPIKQIALHKQMVSAVR